MKSVKIYSEKIRKTVVAAVTGVMMLFAPAAFALSSSYYATTSKLSSGKWVKIKTSGEGIHQISYDQLRQWGFNNPERVNVYGYDATVLSEDEFTTSTPDDVKLTYTLHEGDNLYFYSGTDHKVTLVDQKQVNTRRNLYSTETYYLLSDREVNSSERPTVSPYVSGRKAYDAHLSVNYVEEELQNPTTAGAYFLGQNIPVDGSVDLPFVIRDNNSGNTPWNTSTIRLAYAALNNSSTTVQFSLPEELSYEGVSSSKSSVASTSEAYVKYKLGYSTASYTQTLSDGTHTFAAYYPSNNPSFVAMDYHYLIYPRLSRIDEETPWLSMYFPAMSNGSYNFAVKGGATTHVINVSQPETIYEHEVVYDDETATVQGSFDSHYASSSNRTYNLVAFDTRYPQKEVEFVKEVENQNLHALQTPEMVIITTADLMQAAENLADIHRRYDNMNVVVVDHEKLFNEFSSATPEIMGYRRFLKMLYDRAPEKLKYIIMYGPSVWDNRGLIIDKKERLLVYETPEPQYSSVETKAFASDCYLGMLADNFKPEKVISTVQNVVVGRIPASSNVKGLDFNAKIEKYIQNLPSVAAYNNVVLMSDDGDSNMHLDQAEDFAKVLTTNHPAITVVRAHNLIYPWESSDAKVLRAVATAAFKQGAGMFAYVGHGNADEFGKEHLWNRNYAKSTTYDLPNFSVFATCSVFGFDLGKDNIGEDMLYMAEGGAISLVAAGRVVYAVLNKSLSESIGEAYARARPGTTMGQIWMDGRNNLLGTLGYNSEYQVNTMCYNFGGDPALPVSAPGYKVKIASVEGAETDPEGFMTIEPGKTLTIKGNIVTTDNEAVKDFDGVISVHIYDGEYTVPTIIRDKDVADKVTLNHDILLSKKVEVKDGEFNIDLIAPVPVHESAVNRVTLHADATDLRRADGVLENLGVIAKIDKVEEIEGGDPVIEYMTVNNSIFSQDNMVSDNQVRIIARGTVDKAGLNLSSSIGAGSSLVIDGKNGVSGAKEMISVNLDNTWTLSTLVNNLEVGAHSATLTIIDNAGRRDQRTINFTVGNIEEVELIADRATVHDKVTFDVNHDLTDVTSARLVIEDRKGNDVVKCEDVTFPYTYSFNDNGELPSGHYKAYIQMTSSNGYAYSKRIPLVLLRQKQD